MANYTAINLVLWDFEEEVESEHLNQMANNTEYLRETLSTRKISDRYGQSFSGSVALANGSYDLQLYAGATPLGSPVNVPSGGLDATSSPDGATTLENLRMVSIDSGVIPDGNFYEIKLVFNNAGSSIEITLEPYFFKDPEMNFLSLFGDIDIDYVFDGGASYEMTIDNPQLWVTERNTLWD